MKLRDYQDRASQAVKAQLDEGKNPVVVMPTGSGKSIVIADLAYTSPVKVLVLTHSEELVRQNARTYERYADGRRTSPGVLCSGLNRFETNREVTFASVQTAASRDLPPAGLIIVDEAHRVPPRTVDSQYKSVLEKFSEPLVGLSATPWRMDSGGLVSKDSWFTSVVEEAPVNQLVADGWLAPLVPIESEEFLKVEALEVSGGDYAVGAATVAPTWMAEVTRKLVVLASQRKRVLVFAPNVALAGEMAKELSLLGEKAQEITGETADREEKLSAWEAGNVKWTASVDVLTTGFDMPRLDCIVLLRPTMSTSLHVQMLGRGMRVHPEKENCLVIDCAGNLKRLGGVAMIAGVAGGYSPVMPQSAVALKKARKKSAERMALDRLLANPMLGAAGALKVWVRKVRFFPVPARHGGKHLMASYEVEMDDGFQFSVEEFVCVEARNGARWHAEKWFDRRGVNGSRMPYDARSAMRVAWTLPVPRWLTVKARPEGGGFNVVDTKF